MFKRIKKRIGKAYLRKAIDQLFVFKTDGFGSLGDVATLFQKIKLGYWLCDLGEVEIEYDGFITLDDIYKQVKTDYAKVLGSE